VGFETGKRFVGMLRGRPPLRHPLRLLYAGWLRGRLNIQFFQKPAAARVYKMLVADLVDIMILY
jgi:hypothetical protein